MHPNLQASLCSNAHQFALATKNMDPSRANTIRPSSRTILLGLLLAVTATAPYCALADTSFDFFQLSK